MWFEYIWITLTAIAIISNNNVSHAQSQNISESKPVYLEYEKNKKEHDTPNKENITLIINSGKGIHTERLFGDVIANSMKNFLPFSNVNENCTRDGQLFMNDLNNQALWAVQMYTSSSKYPGDILSGEVNELGYFDQCLRVSSKRLRIHGAYALANVRFYTPGEKEEPETMDQHKITKTYWERSNRDVLAVGPANLLWALCFPDSCTDEDIRMSVNSALVPAFRARNISVKVSVPTSLYTSKNTMLGYSYGVFIAYGIFIVLFALAIAGTLYDLFADRSKPENATLVGDCLHSFSIITNIKNLMGDSKSEAFSVVNGIKFYGLISVIIGHRVALNIANPSFEPEHVGHIISDYLWSALKSPVPVEIFFVISGFFTYIHIEERLTSGKSLDFMFLFFYRVIRIIPSYITVIAIFAFVFPYIGDGPFWKLIIYPEAEFCRKNWWTNILFINNYVNSDQMCMLHTWYLACDIHFFIVGILLTYIVWRWNKAGLGIFGILFALSIYLPAKSIYDGKQWGLMPFFPNNAKNIRVSDHFNKIYIKSHYRITTYLIGIAAAYIYLHIKQSKFKLSVKNRTMGFTICLIFQIICFVATGNFYSTDLSYNPWNHIIIFTFQRIVYSLTVSYWLVVGSLSNFGFISSFFESKIFIVIGRLSYLIYLIHLFVQFQSTSQIRQPQYGSFWILFSEICADLIISVSYSVLINLIVEAPNRNIVKKLMKMRIKTENESNLEVHNGVENNGQS